MPRGKNTLTSRLFVLERVKKELDRQFEEAKLAQRKKNPSTTTISSSFVNANQNDYDDDENENEDEEIINEFNFRKDLLDNLDSCAFTSINQKECLTNEQVYQLLNNQSDLVKFSKTIEYQLYKPDEQMCTTIDLSMSNSQEKTNNNKFIL